MKRHIRISIIGLATEGIGVYVAHADGSWADTANDLADHELRPSGDHFVIEVDLRTGDLYKILIFGLEDEDAAARIHSERRTSGVLRGKTERFNWDTNHVKGPNGETGGGAYWLLDPDPDITVVNEGEWNANCVAP